MKLYTLVGVLILLNVANAIDAGFTAYLYNSDIIMEANPLMEAVISRSIYNFILIKLFLTISGTFLLFRLRKVVINSYMYWVVMLLGGLYSVVCLRYFFWFIFGG